MKRIAILGSTGSIGVQALEVIAAHPHRFHVVGLAARARVGLLREQIAAFRPDFAGLSDETAAGQLKSGIADGVTILGGQSALRELALQSNPDLILAATDGAVAFDAVFEAVERGVDVAVANKELIVAAGELLFASAKRSGARILPVDSEHSALFQCLLGEQSDRVAALILTASGGPFRTLQQIELQRVTVAQALAHPTWRMGPKNSVDSATLMNKGLEVVEASRFFDQPPQKIHVLIHPQSIVHGMVVFSDGNVKAQVASPDMRVPIGYALGYPDRLEPTGGVLDPLVAAGGNPAGSLLRYDFGRPDPQRFPCLRLAYEALAMGGTAPAILSAANEIAVEAFLNEAIGFAEIPLIIEKVMKQTVSAELTLTRVREADAQARSDARALVDASRRQIEV